MNNEEMFTKLEQRMNEMQVGMDAKMADLQSQNQLLLSKISALSSQNSNAPGIFDGADRRKLEAKQEKLRQSGQKVTPAVRQRQLAFFDMECAFFKKCDRGCLFCSCYADPMWLIPVSTLLQCEHMPSHQEALSKGMLCQYTSEIAGRVIFGE